MTKYIALLRGINVGGHKKIPMADLKYLASGIGFDDVQSYIQSGNLAFSASDRALDLENKLERAIEKKFGFFVPVLIRSSPQWLTYVDSNPFSEEADTTPNLVILALSKKPAVSGIAAQLSTYATLNERIVQTDGALWLYFCGGSGKSKISPVVLDRLAGSPVTTRNWQTVLKLNALAGNQP